MYYLVKSSVYELDEEDINDKALLTHIGCFHVIDSETGKLLKKSPQWCIDKNVLGVFKVSNRGYYYFEHIEKEFLKFLSLVNEVKIEHAYDLFYFDVHNLSSQDKSRIYCNNSIECKDPSCSQFILDDCGVINDRVVF